MLGCVGTDATGAAGASDGPAWTVCAADPEQADATVRVDAVLATPLFSRALDRTAAGWSFTVGGEATLAEGAREALARLTAR